jgi:hypothetical protein
MKQLQIVFLITTFYISKIVANRVYCIDPLGVKHWDTTSYCCGALHHNLDNNGNCMTCPGGETIGFSICCQDSGLGAQIAQQINC